MREKRRWRLLRWFCVIAGTVAVMLALFPGYSHAINNHVYLELLQVWAFLAVVAALFFLLAAILSHGATRLLALALLLLSGLLAISPARHLYYLLMG